MNKFKQTWNLGIESRLYLGGMILSFTMALAFAYQNKNLESMSSLIGMYVFDSIIVDMISSDKISKLESKIKVLEGK